MKKLFQEIKNKRNIRYFSLQMETRKKKIIIIYFKLELFDVMCALYVVVF